MRVLITYASAGAGHFKAAEAIYDYLNKRCGDIDIKLVDILDKTNPFFKFTYTFGYWLLVSRAPIAWRIAYWFTELKALRFFTGRAARIMNRINSRKFIRFLIQYNPDFIISTHFLSSEISCLVKRARKIKSELVTVITDFAVHPFWVSTGTDKYIVATAITKNQLVKHGVEENIIIDSGIPVHPKFLQQLERKELCRKLGISENKFTVLIATGSFGIGPIEEIIKSLYQEVQILVVCANNKKLYKKLKASAYPDVWVFGFVDNMQELMSVSELIITKPGGLTISEILIRELVPLFVWAIPGQEAGNVEVLKQYAIGLSLKSTSQIKKKVLEFKNNPNQASIIKNNIKKIKKVNCLEEICNVICQSSSGPAC